MSARQTCSLLIVTSLFFAGCGSDNPLNRQAVTGEITLGTAPLAQGSIEFTPKASGQASGAKIEDGRFSIPADKGLPPGEYLVRISASGATAEAVEMPGDSRAIAAELIPAQYNTDSTETFTVKAGEKNIYKLIIEVPQ
ncbi:MAG TPA: hypothetical protein PLY87_26230 [Planctomycetaceae bacterium]|nr:hypothetical protein [Planctomycetaceae bacterium]HQZ68623.1 hypothetical protein [Planctomycetaceae bacterium]